MLKGVTNNHVHTRYGLDWTSMSRSAWTQPEGVTPAFLHEAIIFNVNLVTWTVDIYTKFDQKIMMDIQVGSPYMNPVNGEGIYAVPEVGSKCIVAVPSDGPPPFVLCFIMPMMTQPTDTSSEDAEQGSNNSFTFSGGRMKSKPGDIVAKGRDGNFMVLHRGGVAQFGATPLAQRICVPLQNLVTDIAQNYNLFSGGGSINWGVQERGNNNPGAEMRQTFRVYANDQYADIRADVGRVRSPVPEPAGAAGEKGTMQQLGIGTDEEIVYELVLARNGFETQSGEFKGVLGDVRLRFFFDRGGNALLRFEGAVGARIKDRFRLTVDKMVELISHEDIRVTSDSTVDINGKSLVKVGTQGGTVQLNGGGRAVAHVGSVVRVVVGAPVPIMVLIPPATAPVPATIVAGTLEGLVMTGNPTVLV